eukprot:scaffold3587_cov109-Isochrysis_galbana.AAC.6
MSNRVDRQGGWRAGVVGLSRQEAVWNAGRTLGDGRWRVVPSLALASDCAPGAGAPAPAAAPNSSASPARRARFGAAPPPSSTSIQPASSPWRAAASAPYSAVDATAPGVLSSPRRRLPGGAL